MGGWGRFARTLRQEGRRQSVTPTCASATTRKTSFEFETYRTGNGVEKRSALGTTGTSDLVKALAGGAHWRGPADATWSRVSRRAALPTATTKVALVQSVPLQSPAGIRSHCAKPDRKLRFRWSLPADSPPGRGRNSSLRTWVPELVSAGPEGLPLGALRSASNLGPFPR